MKLLAQEPNSVLYHNFWDRETSPPETKINSFLKIHLAKYHKYGNHLDLEVNELLSSSFLFGG